MSLYMRIYHGHTDTQPKKADWGLQGPLLMYVKSVRYHLGHLFIEYVDTEAMNSVNQMVNWQLKPLEYGRENSEMIVDFARPNGYPQLVKVEHTDKPTMFYSTFKIAFDPFNVTLKLKLILDLGQLKKYPQLPKEFILNGVQELYFNNGYYEVIFSDERMGMKAQQQTGWLEGVAPFKSLEIPINKLGNITIPGEKFGVDEDIKFYQFILSV